jgi:transposase
MTSSTLAGMGCDPHLDTITAAVVDATGRPVDRRRCANTERGFTELARMCRRHGLDTVGIEGASSYGQPLAVFLTRQGIRVIDVPTRVTASGRDSDAKTDPGDAVAIARAVLADRGHEWVYDPRGEALRVVVHRRESLVRAQTADINQLRALLKEVDPDRAATLTRLRSVTQLKALARARYGGNIHRETVAATIRSIARTCIGRRVEIDQLTKTLPELLPPAAHAMIRDVVGCGVITAAILFAELAGTNGFASHAKFGAWTGTAPIPVSSGRTDRHRLNRGGNRQANRAIHVIIVTQQRCGGQAATYIARRRQEGKTTKEAIRAAKRYLARRLWIDYLQPTN